MAQNTASLNEIAFNLLNSIRGGRSSNTEHLSLSQIKFMIKYYRNVFIRRDEDRNNFRPRMFEQTLGLVTMETVDQSHDSATVETNELVRRSTVEIPVPVRLKLHEAITHISEANKYGKPIPLINANRSYWQQFNKYTDEEPYAVYEGGYLYVFNDITVNNLNIRGIFEDPEEVYEFTKANATDLYDDNEPFPIPQDMLEGITKGILNGELRIIQPEDNDTQTDTLQQ